MGSHVNEDPQQNVICETLLKKKFSLNPVIGVIIKYFLDPLLPTSMYLKKKKQSFQRYGVVSSNRFLKIEVNMKSFDPLVPLLFLQHDQR